MDEGDEHENEAANDTCVHGSPYFRQVSGARPTRAAYREAVFDITHLLQAATPEHLGHQALIVGRLVARMGVCEPIPVLGKDLLEDVPAPRGNASMRAHRVEVVSLRCSGFIMSRPLRLPQSVFTGAPSTPSFVHTRQ